MVPYRLLVAEGDSFLKVLGVSTHLVCDQLFRWYGTEIRQALLNQVLMRSILSRLGTLVESPAIK